MPSHLTSEEVHAHRFRFPLPSETLVTGDANPPAAGSRNFRQVHALPKMI